MHQKSETNTKTATVGIVGAGIAGICLALDLQRKGYDDFVIYERDDAVGGTWNNNRYPGCRCDIPAIVYSHSQYPNPDWTETHPPRPEILKYWQRLSDKQGVTPKVRFGHSYVHSEWNASTSSWKLTFDTASGRIDVSHKILISAIGGFSTPRWPSCDGLNGYKGQVIHTSRWPNDLTVDKLSGKEVMVVGNGCTGAQLITALASNPDTKVIALSKSQHWLAPSPTSDGPHSVQYTSLEKFLHRISIIYWLLRLWTWCKLDANYIIFRPKAVRMRAFISKRMGQWMAKRAPESLKENIVPAFPYGAKRLVMDGGYLNALNSPNVTAVWDNLASATPEEVTTGTGQKFSPDLIALATGYDVKVGLNMTGRDGYEIRGDRSHIPCYYGTAVPGYPNCFQMLGANVAPAHFSVAFYLEVQSEYISKCIVKMRDYDIRVMEVKQSATDEYNQWLDKRLEQSIWATADHYYRADNGKGRVYTHFPGSATLFWWINRNVRWGDYVGTEKIARDEKRKTATLVTGAAALIGAAAWYYLV